MGRYIKYIDKFEIVKFVMKRLGILWRFVFVLIVRSIKEFFKVLSIFIKV